MLFRSILQKRLGVEPNRPTLEAFLQYAFEQGVGRKRLAVEDLFARETLESFKI